ncbi:biliverdin-producing heme oxygenase [Niveispirillum sp. SYP-B3756]|uniref:biliverdin-producing heme oxygenase n=1 Tax=Niveispirillum sp. SYP-B3756 TaxID=2662178 RepID=UPI0012926D2A|nr:biliverdin-producing heme oxygenase [Niveispirillum sp. SYP-B3756]MQP67301.1 biliverdin-producing heme oxygenase [Niveispirillum sp. SYP-B3756]
MSLLLERLRQETRPQHEALEKTLDLLSPTLDMARYHAILRRFHAFWRGWQPPTHGLLVGEPDLLAGRDRTPLLAADLAHFGLTPLPAAAPLPLSDAGAALGSLYVLEGSTLGGQLISRHLETRLGLRNGAGYAYFQGYGRQNGPMWAAMRERLARHPAEGSAADRLLSGAKQTFSILEQRFAI